MSCVCNLQVSFQVLLITRKAATGNINPVGLCAPAIYCLSAAVRLYDYSQL